MNKRNLSILILVGILFLTVSTFSVEQKPIVSQQKQSLNLIKSADQCNTPQIYEFIRKFMIPVKDVDGIVNHQLSRSNLSNIQAADKVVLHTIIYQSKLLNQNQSESYQTPLKAVVINDQTRFTFTYQVNLTEGTLAKVHQFNGTTTLDNVKFTYTKQLNPQTGVSKFSDVAISIDVNKMKSSFSPSPNQKQTKKLQNAIKAANHSLYASFKNFLSVQQFTTFLQSNAKKSAMSRTFDSNPFKYDFYHYITNIDVSTLSIVLTDRTDGDYKDLMNGISAKLQSAGKYCSSYVPDANNTSPLMFISTEFIQNFIDFSIVNYKNWSNIEINKKSSRSELLQFRLLDLEYIVDGLLEGQLAPYYQNQILFRCQVMKNVQTSFDTDNKVLLQGLDWQCYSYVQNVNGKQVKVMDFQPRIKHIIDFKVSSSNNLMAGMNKLEYIDCVFNAVDGKYNVTDKRVAQKYIETVFNEYRTPSVLGSYFKLPQNSRTVDFGQNNIGLWIY